jgi:protein SCO1/2
MLRKTTWFIIILVLCSLTWTDRSFVQEGTCASYTKTVETYEVPDVVLTDQKGSKVRLREILLGEKPVLVDFVYTTCTTICPVLSANFTNFQRKMGAKAGTVQLVSISIDPENDTPKAMRQYLERYHAKPGWEFLTGTKEDIERVIRVFHALSDYSYNKMEHYPLIILKAPGKDEWIRIYGLIGTGELMKEFEGVQQ